MDIKIIFVGPSRDVYHTLNGQALFKDTPHLTSAQAAIEYLLEDHKVDLIIFQKTKEMNTFLKYLASIESKLPIVFITEDLGATNVFSQLNVLGSISPFEIHSKIVNFILRAISERDKAEAEIAKQYQKIELKILEKALPCPIDLYLRLSDTKFIKIFKGDTLYTFGDLKDYIAKKKTDSFFVLNKDADKFVMHFRSTFAKIAEHVEPNGVQGAQMAQSVHDTILGLSRLMGFAPEVQELARNNVKYTVKNIAQKPELFQLLSLLYKEGKKTVKNESVVLAHIACSLAVKLNWTSEFTFQKLTLAAFFHDIELELKHGPSTLDFDAAEFMAQLSPEDREAYLQHPAKAAEIVSRFQEIPPTVDTIILQHHESPDGSGFPLKIHGKDFAPLSALFIVSHDLIRFLLKNPGKAKISEFVELKKEIYGLAPFRVVLQGVAALEEDQLLRPSMGKVA